MWGIVIKSIFRSTVHSVVGAPQKDIRGEIVLITGTGSGLGRLLALAFAQRGATVVGWDVNSASNEKTAAAVRAEGGRMHVYICDVRQVILSHCLLHPSPRTLTPSPLLPSSFRHYSLCFPLASIPPSFLFSPPFLIPQGNAHTSSCRFFSLPLPTSPPP